MTSAPTTASAAHRRRWSCRRLSQFRRYPSAMLDTAMVGRAQLVQRLHEGGDVVRVGELADAVAQVEDMAGALAVAVEDTRHLGANRRRTGEQHRSEERRVGEER